MKIDILSLYQKSLLGGIGGLLGWGLITLFAQSSSQSGYSQIMMMGALIGLTLGACCGAWDGVFSSRSKKRLAVGAGIGAGIGLVGGMIGLAIGEAIFQAMPGLFSLAIGWAVFGMFVGANEGIARRMPQKLLFGAYGGLLGGLIGGSTYEWLAVFVQRIGIDRDFAIALGGAIGLTLLGLFIGAMMGLVEDLLREAWLVFTAGRFEGQTRTLDPRKQVTTIGRDELGDICILGDPAIVAHHAQIVSQDGAFVIEAVDGEVLMGKPGNFKPITNQRLSAGDMFQIGSMRARFQASETSK